MTQAHHGRHHNGFLKHYLRHFLCFVFTLSAVQQFLGFKTHFVSLSALSKKRKKKWEEMTYTNTCHACCKFSFFSEKASFLKQRESKSIASGASPKFFGENVVKRDENYHSDIYGF